MLFTLLFLPIRLYEACLRCVRTIVTSDACPDGLLFNSPAILAGVLCCINKSVSIQEYTCEILTHCCKVPPQRYLYIIAYRIFLSLLIILIRILSSSRKFICLSLCTIKRKERKTPINVK